MGARKIYYEQLFRALGHRAPRRYVMRHPHKFLRILWCLKVNDIKKHMKSGYFSHLSKNEIPVYQDFLSQKAALEKDNVAIEKLSNIQSEEFDDAGDSVFQYMDEISSLKSVRFSTKGKISISIIIPVYEKFELTFNCLQSLSALYSNRSDIEVIIADDSQITSYAKELALKECVNVKLVRNASEEGGFLTNCNYAAQEAQGDYLLFLNNDTIALPGWLEGLERHLVEDEVKIVGSKLIYPDGSLQEAGGAVFSDGEACNIGRNSDADHPFYNFSRESDYISGASMLVETEWFKGSGMFDERYIPAYYEDTDLCVRAKQQGYKVIYSAESRIIHLEGQTCGSDENVGGSVKSYQIKNKVKFMEKWDLSHYRDSVRLNEHEYHIHKRAQILVVTPYPVRTDIDSGSKRLYHLLLILQEKFDVVLYIEDYSGLNQTTHLEPWVRDLNYHGIEVLTKMHYLTVEGVLENREFSCLWVSWLEAALKLIPTLAKYPELPVVYDTVDLHFVREARGLGIELENMTDLSSQTSFEKEMDVIKSANKVVVVSDFERELLRTRFDLPSYVIGNLEALSEPVSRALDTTKDIIGFIGNCQHTPNVDSINYFLENHWSEIKALNPRLEFRIIGNQTCSYRDSWESYPNVTVVGWVESVEDAIEDLQFTIAPLLYGAGVKGKINQSLAAGVPVLASQVAAEGMLDPEGGMCGIEVAEISDFAIKIKELLSNKSRLNTQSIAGVKWVNELCGYDTARREICKLFENCLLRS